MTSVDKNRRSEVQAVVVWLLQMAHAQNQRSRFAAGLFAAAEQLAHVVGTVSQAELARRLHRSEPTVRRLIALEHLPRSDNGRIPSLHAAMAEVALAELQRSERNLAERVAAYGAWLSEMQNSQVRQGYAQYLRGEAQPLDLGVTDDEAVRIAEEFYMDQDRASVSEAELSHSRR